MSIAREHRFSPSRPCPVCGGHDRMKRGNGERCFGFSSEDGTWAHCTREEYAGELEYNANIDGYAHKLVDDCRCGVRHDPNPQANGRALASEIEKTYDYRNADGKQLFQVVRYFPKGFRQRRPDGAGGWIWNLEGVERALYRLPELLAADERETVYMVEGEKDADRLAALGLVATTNPEGARKWRSEYTAALRGRHVAIVPDNDEAGLRHAELVASALRGVATSVKVVTLW
jgi:hypothetical protein